VIEIIAEGDDPDLVRDFATMVSAKMVVYVQELYETYDLKPLDEATRPSSPVKPNKTLNLALGAILGLALGGGLAFLSEYLQAPLEETMNLGIFDNETGAYSRPYFRQRLREEMSRAKRNAYPLSLALMNVDQLDMVGKSLSPQARSEALRKVTVFLKQYLREEDILARLDGTIFALMLPDVMEEEAKAMLEQLQTRIAWTPFEIEKSGIKLNLSSTAGVVAYRYNGTGQDEFLDEADRALRQAEASGYGKVCLFSGNGNDQSTQVE
jgi:diguanylate cyclase (GGDEF)-like protein